LPEKKLEFHENLNLEKFWLNWFGIHGRELGSNIPHPFGTCPKGWGKSRRMFTINPETYLKFIAWCHEKQSACWITSQPMRAYNTPFGIEKIFFDFDYKGLGKNQNMTPAKREKVKKQVLKFVESLDYEPFIVATRKGFHVYIFLRRIYEFQPRNLSFASEVFGVLGLSMLGMRKLYCELTEDDRKTWKYLDFAPLGDIVRMARIPLTSHEKTGLMCRVLNRSLEPTKVRGVELFRGYGLREDNIREAVELVKAHHKKQISKQWRTITSGAKAFEGGNGFKGSMRPCFTDRLFNIGEMSHQQRLALLMEAYASGYRTEEKLMQLCRHFEDFKESTSRTQIQWFLKNKAGKFPPYKCKTIESNGWCIKGECAKWRRDHKKQSP